MKRNRTDSAKGIKEIFDGANVVINPPLNIDLGAGVRPYWDKLVKAKATRAWLDQDLILLVELSRNLYRTEKLSKDMLTEEEVFIQENGAMKPNPKSAIIDQLVKRARMIYAMLQIHPEATQGKSREQVDQNKKHTDATLNSQSSDDGLIPQPQAH
tara:strand:+ start:46 stop:513 length:468 start_codon:yes stop_codon:yes gene_type:complete